MLDVLAVSLVLFFHSSLSEVSFTKSPESVYAVNGQTVVFTCSTVMADDLFFTVNETTADEQSIIDKGFIEGLIISDTRTLTTVASTMYNNTRVTCTAVNFSPFVIAVSNPPAILLVQGPLTPVVDLSYSFIAILYAVNISWSPPLTLPGTDITGYNISATSNGTTTNYFTSDSHYELLLTDITDSPCNEIIITVSGYNGLDGENESLTDIYLPSAVADTAFSLSVRLGLKYEIIVNNVTVNVSSLCIGQYPTHINLTVQQYNGSLVATHNNIPLLYLSTDLLIATNINDTLPIDKNYTAIVTFTNEAGIFNITSLVGFNTILIRSINSVTILDNVSPDVLFVCQFNPDIESDGCLIELKNENFKLTSNGSRTSDDQAIVTFSGVVSGLYCLRVFDIRSNGMLVIGPELGEITILPESSSVSMLTMTSALVYSIRSSTIHTTSGAVISPISTSSSIVQMTMSAQDLIISVSVSAGVVIVILCCSAVFMVVLIVCGIVSRYKRTRKKLKNKDSPDKFLVEANPAYSCVNTTYHSQPSSTKKNVNILVDKNPSYSQVIVSNLNNVQENTPFKK